MQEDSYRTIATLLASTKPEDLRQGLELVRKEIARVGCDEAKPTSPQTPHKRSALLSFGFQVLGQVEGSVSHCPAPGRV